MEGDDAVAADEGSAAAVGERLGAVAGAALGERLGRTVGREVGLSAITELASTVTDRLEGDGDSDESTDDDGGEAA